MRIIGFGDFDFEPQNYYIGISPYVTLTNSVTPTPITRPGTTPTWGLPIIGPMTIVGTVGYKPGAYSSAEVAYLNFFKRIDPTNYVQRELRAIRLDNALLKILAVVEVPPYSSEEDVLIRDIIFHCAGSIWTAAGYTTGTGGFN